MENFNGSLNGEQQEQTSMAKGIIFAIIGMLIGIIPYLIVGGLLEFRGWYIAGASVGICVSIGWHVGKGPVGALRLITMILLSIIGSFITIILGYAIFYHRQVFGFDFMFLIEEIIYWFLDGFDDLFGEYGEITFDVLGAMVVAIVVSWRKFNPNAGSEDLEELDNELEDINADNRSSANTEMDDLLNRDVPTLKVDENWNCAKCGATNRSIVDTCEYCGENK